MLQLVLDRSAAGVHDSRFVIVVLQVLAGSTCYMFDMLHQDVDILRELKSLLQNPSVVKVMHDCRQDSEALFYQKQIKLENVFDTQVAAPLPPFSPPPPTPPQHELSNCSSSWPAVSNAF